MVAEISTGIMDANAVMLADDRTQLKTIRVLIVDDSPVAIHGLRSILQTYRGVEVVGDAANGSEGIAKAEELRPSLVLMDAQMPDMDGVEATRHIKGRFPDMKVLFMTVHATHVDAALDAGADGYLMKDSSRQELVQAIRRLAL